MKILKLDGHNSGWFNIACIDKVMKRKNPPEYLGGFLELTIKPKIEKNSNA